MGNNVLNSNNVLNDPSGGGDDSGGGGGGSSQSKTYEDISSQANNSNTTFTTSNSFVSNSVELYYNGIRQRNPNEFTETNSTTISLNFTPKGSPSVLTVAYFTT